jgi:hypothetical protein
MERDEGSPRVRIRDLVRYYLHLGASLRSCLVLGHF